MKTQEIGKGQTLAYVIPLQYETYSANDENSSEKVIHTISATVSETEIEMLPAIPICSKMIFPGDLTLVRKFYYKMPKNSKGTLEKTTISCGQV